MREVLPQFLDRRLTLARVGCDPWNAGPFAMALLREGLEVVEVPQTVKNMSDTAKLFEALIRTRRQRHDGNPVMQWCASNVAAKEDKKGNIYPYKPQMRKRIDGVISSVIALGRLSSRRRRRRPSTRRRSRSWPRPPGGDYNSPMLIPKDSHFRRLPTNLVAHQRVLFEGIAHCISGADLSFQQLQSHLAHITRKSVKGQVGLEATAAAFTLCWSILDSAHRLRLLLQRVPGWKKTPALRSYVDSSHGVTVLRNGFQHLDKEIAKIADAKFPTWGLLHWSSEPRMKEAPGVPCHHTLIAGGLPPGPVPSIIGRAGPKDAVVWGISMVAFGQRLFIEPLLEEMRRVVNHLEKTFQAQFVDRPSMGSGFHIVIAVVPSEQPPPSPPPS